MLYTGISSGINRTVSSRQCSQFSFSSCASFFLVVFFCLRDELCLMRSENRRVTKEYLVLLWISHMIRFMKLYSVRVSEIRRGESSFTTSRDIFIRAQFWRSNGIKFWEGISHKFGKMFLPRFPRVKNALDKLYWCGARQVWRYTFLRYSRQIRANSK